MAVKKRVEFVCSLVHPVPVGRTITPYLSVYIKNPLKMIGIMQDQIMIVWFNCIEPQLTLQLQYR